MERKIKILLIPTIMVLAALSGIAVMAYANGTTNSTNTTSNVMYGFGGYFNDTCAPFGGPHGHGHGGRCGWGWGGSITVSQEYKDNVINIAKNDSDVQNLLAEGYNITGIRPIIDSTVEADGTVTTKATTAVVTLTLNTTGRAYVWVNVEQAKVTRIEILTRTVIEKP